MSFLMETTKCYSIESDSLEKFKNAFVSKFGEDKTQIGFEEFKKALPCKDEFFVTRLFKIFDCDQNGSISVTEFCESIHEFSTEEGCSFICSSIARRRTNKSEILQKDH